MKRTRFISFCILLVLVMLFTTAGAAIAAPSSDGPFISAPSGGGTLTTTLVPVSKLPGTVTNAAGTVFPQGHESGDLSFGGDGLKVSGLVGSATISFPLANYTFGWTGCIYQYLNGQWVMLPTTVTPKPESTDAIATATIYSDGIYVLIISYKQPDVEAMKPCKNIDSVYVSFDIVEAQSLIRVAKVIFYPQIKSGTHVTYSVINFDPDSGFNLYTGSTTGAGSAVNSFEGWIGNISTVTFGQANRFRYSGSLYDNQFTVRFILNHCYIDVNYPDGFGA
jgi:hypothetical protein